MRKIDDVIYLPETRNHNSALIARSNDGKLFTLMLNRGVISSEWLELPLLPDDVCDRTEAVADSAEPRERANGMPDDLK